MIETRARWAAPDTRARRPIHARRRRPRRERLARALHSALIGTAYAIAFFALVYGALWIALQNPVLDAVPVTHVAGH